jgi:hypothetical protein
MTFADAVTVLQTHLVTAGASLSDPIGSAQVRAGEPSGLLARTIAWWYDGDQESNTGGRTLSENNVQEKVTIRVYWPVPSRDDPLALKLELAVREANRAIQAQLWGDAHLGGNCIGIAIDASTAGWQEQGSNWLRVLTIPLFIDMAWVEPIATPII